MYLYSKDFSEPKYEFLFKNHENARTKHFGDSNAFIKWSNTMSYVDQNIDDYNPSRKRKVLIVFHDMIAGTMSKKKFEAIIKGLYIRCRKLNILHVFMTQFYFFVPKDVILNSKH